MNGGRNNWGSLRISRSPVEMAKTRRAKRSSGTRKAKKQSGGKKSRRLSPKLREWNEKVMRIYREMKRKDPNTRLGDAMKAAKKA